MALTSRWKIPFPDLLDAADPPADMQEMALALDDVMKDDNGTLAARPAASKRGRYYFATDTLILYRDNGITWDAVLPKNCAARVQHSATVAIPSGAFPGNWVTLPWDTALFDTDNIHDPSVNNDRLTCRTAGYYAISGHVILTNNSGGNNRVCRFRFNGTTNIGEGGWAQVEPGGASAPRLDASMPYYLNVGDYVQFQVAQDSGVTLTTFLPGEEFASFEMARIA